MGDGLVERADELELGEGHRRVGFRRRQVLVVGAVDADVLVLGGVDLGDQLGGVLGNLGRQVGGDDRVDSLGQSGRDGLGLGRGGRPVVRDGLGTQH